MPALLGRVSGVGLRWRLAGWVAIAIVLCIAITFVAVYSGTGTQVRDQIDNEISSDASQFQKSIEGAEPRSLSEAAQAALRYVHGQPFSTSSTSAVLFAEIPEAGPITNDPQLFAAHGKSLAGELRTVHLGSSTLRLDDLRVFENVVPLPGIALPCLTRPNRGCSSYSRNNVVIGVAEPLAPVARAQEGVAQAFILAGALALAIGLLGAYLIGTRMSRPLRRMAAVAARVDGGDLHPRIRGSHMHGNEIGVLADAFNHMLDRLTEAFASQRAFVADASHELRTPLTVIRGQLEVLASREAPSAEEVRRVDRLLQAEISRISRLIDDLLLLARSEHTEFLRVEAIDIGPFVKELWEATNRLAERHFVLEAPVHGRLLADPDRLAQALRNLLDNAIKQTAPPEGLVRLRVEQTPGEGIRFAVEDDGPGIPAEERERVFDRFHRTDSARDRASGGTGLGLAIVAAIATAHEGSVRAGEAAGGGAKMALELPRFQVSRLIKPPSSPSRTSV